MNTKVLYLTYFMRLVLLLFTTSVFQACVDNKYDLDKDLSLEVSVGGKHLAVPLGTTSNIYLDSLVDAKDGDILNFLENGDFALSKTDSLDIKIPKIDPVNITVKGLDIDPISVTVDNIQLPEQFTLGDFNENVPLGADNIELTVVDMAPITVDKQKEITGATAGTTISNARVTLEDTKNFEFSFQKVDEIQEVKTVYFGDNTQGSLAQVTITLPEIITTTNHTIEDFSVTLPTGFKLLQDPANIDGTVSGNTFSVTNYNPGDQKTIHFSFYIAQVSGNFSSTGSNISYSGDMECSISYKVSGTFNQTGKANIGIAIEIPLSVKNADIATKDIPVQVTEQSININSKIENIPEEIASVNTIHFDETANEINISISPLELPVTLSGNDIQLQFPATFHFKPSDGLTGNILNIPASELNSGTTKTLHLESVEVDQNVQNNEIILNKAILLLPSEPQQGLQLDASSSVNTESLKTLSSKNIQIGVSGNNLKISHASVSTRGITIDIDRAKADMDISEETPKELIAVQEVAFTQNPEVYLHLSFDGIPASVNKVKFKDYTIKFPEFLIFEGNEIQNNRLILNDEVTVSEGFRKTLVIKQFAFGNDNPIANEHLTINDSIILDGQLYIQESDLNSDELANIIIRPTVSITPMELGVVSGKIDPEIDPEKETVDIGDIPDFMKDDDVVLDIMHPLITVNAGNSIGVPVNADLNIRPMQKGNVVTGGVINASIGIEPTGVLGTTTWSNFWISDTEEGMPLNYSYVPTPNLPNLIRKVPDSISIVVTAEADPNALHSIDLSIPEYKLQVKYNISVPIKLGKDLNIIYHDTIDDFHKDIKDYVDYVTEAQIFTEIDNTIPLEMICSAEAIDVNKNVLRGIQVSAPEKVKAAGWDAANGKTTLTQTSFSLILQETVPGEISKLDGLVFKISAKANSTVAGATLKKDQYLKISAKMKIPGGVTVDIDDL